MDKYISVQKVGGKRVGKKKSQLKPIASVTTPKQHRDRKPVPGKYITYMFKYNT